MAIRPYNRAWSLRERGSDPYTVARPVAATHPMRSRRVVGAYRYTPGVGPTNVCRTHNHVRPQPYDPRPPVFAVH